jgi:hypothetical protein
MPKYRPAEWENPIETLDIYSASRANAFEAGADAMLEALRNDYDLRISCLSNLWASLATDWAEAHHVTLITIPDDTPEVKP